MLDNSKQRPTLDGFNYSSDRSIHTAPSASSQLQYSKITDPGPSRSMSTPMDSSFNASIVLGIPRLAARRSLRRENLSRRHIKVDSCRWIDNGLLEDTEADEKTTLMGNGENKSGVIDEEATEEVGTPLEELKNMFTENKINVLLVFLPFAYVSHAQQWNDSYIFILNFLAMVPLASMLGVFTEELAAHTNDVIGGLINATFGNAVEAVVAIQALLAEDYRVVQASLIGSVFSNLLLFLPLGATAAIATLALGGLSLFLPQQFASNEEDEVMISRIGAFILDDAGEVALIPFSWALIGLVSVTAIVTILSEYLVASIDGFCDEFHLGQSFVGIIILPVVGNAVEHISAVSVAYKNKMDLALGVALGSSVQIALFVLPLVVVVGWFTGKEMTLLFPSSYVLVAVGVYFEKDLSEVGY
eukprot:scaffold72399_cov49-Cyclotella_meneghiniana.AAC.7